MLTNALFEFHRDKTNKCHATWLQQFKESMYGRYLLVISSHPRSVLGL